MPLRTRFAPSPTGLLHVGNAYSALICQQWAEQHHAELLLRIEDIDHTRCRDEFTEAIMTDLTWLGIRWHGEPMLQSRRLDCYRESLDRLHRLGLIYPCFCTRRKIQEEVERMGLAPHPGEEGAPYPGTCRDIGTATRHRRMLEERFAWRLDMGAALEHLDRPLSWQDGEGHTHPVHFHVHDDFVIGRKDIGISYHLAVVMDDAAQSITHVIRGQDLAVHTGIHRLLQTLLGLPAPVYIHHPLLCNEAGERLAKRHHAPSLKALREAGVESERLKRYLLHECRARWVPDKILGKHPK